jgi:hypothetical protein
VRIHKHHAQFGPFLAAKVGLVCAYVRAEGCSERVVKKTTVMERAWCVPIFAARKNALTKCDITHCDIWAEPPQWAIFALFNCIRLNIKY